jgi:CubicO group peptidase (beta-lactamase class C family)
MVMTGFPPPPEQRWTLEEWQQHPQNRWSFRHVREVVPTARVARGLGPPSTLPVGKPLDLGIAVPDATTGRHSLGDVLDATFTDGLLVLHDGRVVVEEYPSGMHPLETHLLMSVSKSIVGCVTGILIDAGCIAVEDRVVRHVPELGSSGYADATVRDLLDMRSGVRFSEAYLDPDAEVRLLEQVIGWAPRRRQDLPHSMYEYLATLEQDRPHGGPFSYRSCETDVLGWVCERASNQRMPDLLSETLWSKLLPEQDTDAAVDPAGAVMHDGGLCATLRDLGRFGQMLLNGGRVGDVQVVPQWWLEDTYLGGEDSREAFDASDDDSRLPGGMYRNQFWVPFPDRRALLCLGIHGQLVYVEPARRLVVVKLSSWPQPQNLTFFLDTLAAIKAMAGAVDA